MKKGRHYSEEEVKLIAQSAIGKTFKEIIDSELITIENNKIQKGSLGDIIEEALFGIEKNTESEPDFIDAGIELKVTPYKRNKDNTLSAKERLVLNIIDIVMIKINSTKDVGGVEVADKVTVHLLLSDQELKFEDRVVKKSDKNGLYAAMDIGAIWLERTLNS